MLVRINGVIEDIIMQEGVGKTSQKPWQKKTYVIRDNMYNKEEYNTKVRVDDFGKLDPNKMNPEFIFRSNHIVGEEVDLACYLETNDYGFTNVSYGKPYTDIEAPKENKSSAIKPEEVNQPLNDDGLVDHTGNEEGTSDLPF